MKRITALLMILVLSLALALPALAADPVPVTGITLNETALTLAPKKGAAVKATIEPKNATNKKLAWSSSDEAVATVKNGKITAVGAGTATITATAEDGSGVSASLEVTVIVPVKKILLSETGQLSLPPMLSWRVTAQVEPEDATVQDVVWSSSDEKIAAVDENGTITGVSNGTATITAVAADGSKAKASLKVKVEHFDVIFTENAAQSITYYITPGSHHIRAKVKTGNAGIDTVDYTIAFIGFGTIEEHVTVYPVKAGTDVVSILGSGRRGDFKVFVSPEVFPESGAAALPQDGGEPAEVLFLGIPWGSSYPEAKSILQEQGKSVRSPAQRNDFIRAQIENDVSFSNCVATNAAMDFSFAKGEEDYENKNAMFKGVLYFDPETPFDQIRLAVKSVYGLGNGELNGEDECTWKQDDVSLVLTKKERYIILEITKESAVPVKEEAE